MFSFFRKKKIIPHIKLSGVIGNVGKFKQGIEYSSHEDIIKKEIPGFIATRLQEALWREALHMVANDEATPEQIDLALINGPAPRMAYQGQCMAFHVACGEGGMATNLDQFGPALQLPWTRLKAPELTQELRDKMVNGCKDMSKGKHFLEMAKDRDNAIAAILSAIKNNHPNK